MFTSECMAKVTSDKNIIDITEDDKIEFID